MSDTLFAGGAEVNLSAQPKDAEGNALTGRALTWASSAPSVASVSQAGTVTGIAKGSVTITATSEGKSGQAVLSVRVGGSVPASGGTISAAGGEVTLVVPAGAVGGNTDLFVDTALAPRPDPRLVAGTAFDFGPAGTAFTAPVILKLRYGQATLPNGNQGALGIFLDSAGTWRPLSGATVDSVGKTVSAPVTHFSTYAILGQAAPASISVSPNPATVQVGASGTLTAVVKDAQGNPLTGLPVTWTSTNTTMVTVSPSGVITGVAAGTTTVTASRGALSGSSTVTVTAVPVGSIVVTPNPASVFVAATTPLTATVKDPQGNILSGRVVTWSSGDTAVARAAPDGVVTGVAVGSVVVTASSGGVSGVSQLTVAPAPVASVSVAPSPASLLVGGTVQLTATLRDSLGHVLLGRPVVWSTSDSSVAKVSVTGLVSGLAVGAASISAASGNVTGTSTVSVAAVAVAAISLSPLQSVVSIGGSTTLTATAKDAQGNVLTGRLFSWTSEDPSIATVAQDGAVHGVAVGSVLISAASGGVTGSARVDVQSPTVASVQIVPDSANLILGGSVHLTAVARDSAGAIIPGVPFNWRELWGPLHPPYIVDSLGVVTPATLGQFPLTADYAFTYYDTAVVSSVGSIARINRLAQGGGECGLTATSTTVCWRGMPGLGNTQAYRSACGGICLAPFIVQGPVFTSLTSGGPFVCGVTLSGAGYCWGINDTGELGQTTAYCVDYSAPCSLLPSPIAGGLSFKQISAGPSHACGITVADQAYCWGQGGLGDGSALDQIAWAPVQVAGGHQFTFIATGLHQTCAIDDQQAAWCWGAAGYGLGDSLDYSPTYYATVPSKVLGGLQFQSLSLFFDNICGVTTTGDGYCWGANWKGFPIGIGDPIVNGCFVVDCTPVPTMVQGGIKWRSIVLGSLQVCGVSTSGLGYCWGVGNDGALGTGAATGTQICSPPGTPVTITCSPIPVVPIAGGLIFTQLQPMGAAGSVCGVASGKTYCWGQGGPALAIGRMEFLPKSWWGVATVGAGFAVYRPVPVLGQP